MRTSAVSKLQNWVVGAMVLVMATVMAAQPVQAAHVDHACGVQSIETPRGVGTATRKAIRLLATVLRSPGMPRVINFLAKHGATQEQIGAVVK
jgi:hypothetical protein